ncbi:hypothetical protein PHYPSEUDO_003586 [Phytophthora pseudosyringae]|uniref:RxLR effector protein n=1 Tax=Phytophthora pseudosyringae TaxID=221518 RepID=A0A8T1VU32_9STRA|nr:hypothetical protein PHYPSEUDO_003586 [Phytophthora pseudosyringae]
MRRLFYAAFIVVVAHLASVSAIAAHSDRAELSSLNDPEFPRVAARLLEAGARNRHLRARVVTDDNLGLSPHQERKLKASPLNQISEKLKTTNAAKKLLATAKKTSSTLKKVPGVKSIKNRLLYNKFSRWAKRGVDPSKARAAGKFKNNDEFAMYQVIFRTIKGKKRAV